MTRRSKISMPASIHANECVNFRKDDRTVLVEGGVSAKFVNPRNRLVRVIKYDSCLCREKRAKRADYIIGEVNSIDVIVELKGSDSNLKGSDDRSAARQVEATLIEWRKNELAARRIAALIVFGRMEGNKKGAGRRPRARSTIQSLEAYFLRRFQILLLVRESGQVQFRFDDFMPRH